MSRVKKSDTNENRKSIIFFEKNILLVCFIHSVYATHTWTLKWKRKFRYSQWGKCWLMLFIKSKSIFPTPIISYTNKLWSTPIHIIFTKAVTCREGLCRNDDKKEFSFLPHQSCCFNLCIVGGFCGWPFLLFEQNGIWDIQPYAGSSARSL